MKDVEGMMRIKSTKSKDTPGMSAAAPKVDKPIGTSLADLIHCPAGYCAAMSRQRGPAEHHRTNRPLSLIALQSTTGQWEQTTVLTKVTAEIKKTLAMQEPYSDAVGAKKGMPKADQSDSLLATDSFMEEVHAKGSIRPNYSKCAVLVGSAGNSAQNSRCQKTVTRQIAAVSAA
ncbi:hypothetical protein [Roseobacter weihaiensis]|uniref:hypothetical protein n=1 Tax=Roseobacter weihaiensis TaxID=2763262 RepID=UPI001D0AE138|nr:hypothetical protein [Roseobacter sp. H9]